MKDNNPSFDRLFPLNNLDNRSLGGQFGIDKILEQISDKIVQIVISNNHYTGFFMKTNIGNGEKVYLCTCAHIISQKLVESNTKITLKLNSRHKKKQLKLILNTTEREIQIFPNPIGITFVEIKETVPYLLPDENYLNETDNFQNLKGQRILIMGTSNGSFLPTAEGIIDDVKGNEIYHCISTDTNYYGSAVILPTSVKVIAVHKGNNNNGISDQNYSTLLIAIKRLQFQFSNNKKYKCTNSQFNLFPNNTTILSKETRVKYTGDTVDSICEGNGTMIWKNGTKYDGNWKNNFREGIGKCYYPNGDFYEGAWKNDKREGKGKIIYKNGDSYDGFWKDDLRNGKGIYEFSNKNKYNGDFKNDLRDGEGTLDLNNGDKYTGDWKKDKKDGRGIYICNDGRVYDGEWKDDKKDGKGRFEYLNGDQYEGDWKNDKMEGYGKYTCADGEYVIGNFYNNFPKGEMKYYTGFNKYIGNKIY